MDTPTGVLSLTTGEITAGTVTATIVVVLGAAVKAYLAWSKRRSEGAREHVILSSEERTSVINEWKAYAAERARIHAADIAAITQTVQELKKELAQHAKKIAETEGREHKCQVELAVQRQRVDFLTRVVEELKEQMTESGVRPDSAIHKMLQIEVTATEETTSMTDK